MTDPVEVMADQIARSVGYINGLMSLPTEGRDKFRVRAQAALSALDAAGFSVVETSLVEQAFKDGLAYGSNVAGADADLAWQQSRIRAMLSAAQVKP